MSKKIPKEYAIERLKSIKAKVELYDDILALRMAIDALSAEPMRWITVEQELPTIKGEYLTVDSVGIPSIKVFYDGKFYGDTHHWRDVIAWMPLPKPYEPQESEK